MVSTYYLYLVYSNLIIYLHTISTLGALQNENEAGRSVLIRSASDLEISNFNDKLREESGQKDRDQSIAFVDKETSETIKLNENLKNFNDTDKNIKESSDNLSNDNNCNNGKETIDSSEHVNEDKKSATVPEINKTDVDLKSFSVKSSNSNYDNNHFVTVIDIVDHSSKNNILIFHLRLPV